MKTKKLTFNEAVQAMQTGTKVRRPCWKRDSYWHIPNKENGGIIYYSDGTPAKVNAQQTLANDYEIVESGFIEEAGFIVDDFSQTNTTNTIGKLKNCSKAHLECHLKNRIGGFDAALLLNFLTVADGSIVEVYTNKDGMLLAAHCAGWVIAPVTLG